MGLLGKILEKIGLGAQPAKASDHPTPAVTPHPSVTPATAPATAPKPVEPPPPQAIAVVDVMSRLDELAKKNPEKLNWKVSIVDLLKLLGIDHSYGARKELAVELECPAEKMSDSAQMNMWLHKTVLQKLADNGGNIPKELLD